MKDSELLINSLTLLNGLLRAGVVFGEIEQIRDLVKDLVVSNFMEGK